MERPAQLVYDELKKIGIKYVVTLPDNWIKELIQIVSQDGNILKVPVAREDEGVGICTGLYLAGQDSALLIQNAGLLLCCNALKSLALKYQIPVFMLISNRGAIGELAPYHIAVGQGQVTAPVLDALKIPYTSVSHPSEVGRIAEAHRFCKLSRWPVAVILGKDALVG